VTTIVKLMSKKVVGLSNKINYSLGGKNRIQQNTGGSRPPTG